MSGWSQEQINTFRRMRKEGKSFTQIGLVIHKSRSAVAGRARREDGMEKHRIRLPGSKKRIVCPQVVTGSWDSRVFEPWEVRKARRALERQNVPA